MTLQSIPSFMFPTTVLMIDDNVEFLKSIAIGLLPEKATYNFYSDPALALRLVNEKYRSNEVASSLVNLMDEEEFEHRCLDINIRDLHRIVYNRARFQQISTVVVDFHMPGLNGIEFCESIKNPYIQKILLTSIVDEHKAIEVLNAGIIHTFIRKQSINVMDQLNQAIMQAQTRYFNQLSNIIQQTLNFSPGESALSDPAFVELFHRVSAECGAVEHYLTEFLGSFLFVDAEGNRFNLFTRVQDQLDFFIESKQSETAPKEVLQALRSGERILCCHPEMGLDLPEGRLWGDYMFDSIKLAGQKNDYFCAFGPQMMPTEREACLSFGEYSSPLGLQIVA
jgi:CheY-like chemotaxis protein